MPPVAAPAAPAAPSAATPAAPAAAPVAAPVPAPAVSDGEGAAAPPAADEGLSFRDRFRGKVHELTAPLKAPTATSPAEGAEDGDELDDDEGGADAGTAGTDDNGSGAAEDGASKASGGDADGASDSALPPIQTAKYALVNAEGEPIGAAWDESVTLKLTPAGGKVHEVKSFTELADLAVRGLELRRVVADKGNELRDVRQQHQAAIEQLETAHEDTLLAVLFDEDLRAELQEKLAAWRDPDVRKLATEHRKTRAAEEARAREQQERAAQLGEQLYGLLEQQFTAYLPEYPFLRPEDVAEAKVALHQQYLTLRQTQGDRDAINAAFNDTALRAAMETMNTRLAQRLGSPPPARAPSAPAPAAAKAPAAPDASAAAAQHNAQVEDRLARKRESQTMRGAGAPPVAAEPVAAPKTFGEGRQRIKGLFRTMAES